MIIPLEIPRHDITSIYNNIDKNNVNSTRPATTWRCYYTNYYNQLDALTTYI